MLGPKSLLFLVNSDTGQRCPVDNEMLTEDQLFPDNFAKREILSLTVRCPNSGCVDKMELRQLEVRFFFFYDSRSSVILNAAQRRIWKQKTNSYKTRIFKVTMGCNKLARRFLNDIQIIVIM